MRRRLPSRPTCRKKYRGRLALVTEVNVVTVFPNTAAKQCPQTEAERIDSDFRLEDAKHASRIVLEEPHPTRAELRSFRRDELLLRRREDPEAGKALKHSFVTAHRVAKARLASAG